MFSSYEDVEMAMNKVVQQEFTEANFFRSLRNGLYSMTQVRYFAVQYSHYSRNFPRVLGAAISAMPAQDTWWVPLADNLWDEAGRGAPGKSHEQLYKTFLLSIHPNVGFDERGVPKVVVSKAVSDAIHTFIDFFRASTPLEAMAAVGLGSEMFAGNVMGDIANGFRHPRYNHPPLNLTFWDAHANEHEPRHYQLCKDILVLCTDPNDLAIMYKVGSLIARSEAAMYAQLHEEMLQEQ